MQLYLPIAEMVVRAEVILMLGAVVGLLSGLFGVGGGFLATPLLIFLGVPPSVAVGTQACQLVAVSTNGVLGHWRRGHVDFRLGGVMFGGSVLGSMIGIMLFRLFQHIGQIDVLIPVLYVLLLGSIGLSMLAESVAGLIRRNAPKAERQPLIHNEFFNTLPYKMRFPASRLYVSALVPVMIGLVGGVLVALLGVGGGFILVPAMIYIMGMPPLLVVGTSLFQIMATSVVTTVLHATTSYTVDMLLAVLLIAGGVIGAQAGVRAARRLKPLYGRLLLAVLLLGVASRLVSGLLIEPVELYSLAIR